MPEGRRASSGTGDKKKPWRAKSGGGEERERGRSAVLVNEDGSSTGMRKRHGRTVAGMKVEEIRSWDGGDGIVAGRQRNRKEGRRSGRRRAPWNGGWWGRSRSERMRQREVKRKQGGDGGFWQGKKQGERSDGEEEPSAEEGDRGGEDGQSHDGGERWRLQQRENSTVKEKMKRKAGGWERERNSDGGARSWWPERKEGRSDGGPRRRHQRGRVKPGPTVKEETGANELRRVAAATATTSQRRKEMETEKISGDKGRSGAATLLGRQSEGEKRGRAGEEGHGDRGGGCDDERRWRRGRSGGDEGGTAKEEAEEERGKRQWVR